MNKRRFIRAVRRSHGPEPQAKPSASALADYYDEFVAEHGYPPSPKSYRRWRTYCSEVEKLTKTRR